MNTTQLIDDVRFNITRSNIRDYTDAEIQRNIDEEYKKLQSMMQREGRIEWVPELFTFTMTDDFQVTNPNLHIERVETSTDGGENWYPVTRTTYHNYALAMSQGCKCEKNALTDAFDSTSCPQQYIQTNEGIHVFPVPDGGMQTKIYTRGFDVIDWTDPTFEPKLPMQFHRLLSLNAGLMYRDLEDTNELEWLNNEYNKLWSMFLEHIKEGGQVVQMRKKKKRYL